jgi:hypothetical protein
MLVNPTVDEYWDCYCSTWLEYSITAQLLGWRHSMHACVLGGQLGALSATLYASPFVMVVGRPIKAGQQHRNETEHALWDGF